MKFLYDSICGAASYIFGGSEVEKAVEAPKRIPTKDELPQIQRALALLEKVGLDFLRQSRELRQEYTRRSSAVNLALTDKTTRKYTLSQKETLRANFAKYRENYNEQKDALRERKEKMEAKIYEKYAAIAEFLPTREGSDAAAAPIAPTRAAAAPRP